MHAEPKPLREAPEVDRDCLRPDPAAVGARANWRLAGLPDTEAQQLLRLCQPPGPQFLDRVDAEGDGAGFARLGAPDGHGAAVAYLLRSSPKVTTPRSRSTSPQTSAAASPRRHPVPSANRIGANKADPLAAFNRSALCSGESTSISGAALPRYIRRRMTCATLLPMI